MTIQEFALKPFKSSGETLNFDVTGKASRHGEWLTLTYEVLGELGQVAIPQSASPARQDHLWQTTCFECFLKPVGQAQYWEFNLSPSYGWNVYQFRDYRQGQTLADVSTLSFEVLSMPTVLQTVWRFDLSRLNLQTSTLMVAIATVIQFKGGPLTYWAITHPTTEPDFHHGGSFVITL